VLSSKEQEIWDDVQRFWTSEAEEPPGLAFPAHHGRWLPGDEEEDLPILVVAGIWATITLVIFGAAVAGLAIAAATVLGWALWRAWPARAS
jgi:hypothetical protein